MCPATLLGTRVVGKSRLMHTWSMGKWCKSLCISQCGDNTLTLSKSIVPILVKYQQCMTVLGKLHCSYYEARSVLANTHHLVHDWSADYVVVAFTFVCVYSTCIPLSSRTVSICNTNFTGSRPPLISLFLPPPPSPLLPAPHPPCSLLLIARVGTSSRRTLCWTVRATWYWLTLASVRNHCMETLPHTHSVELLSTCE